MNVRNTFIAALIAAAVAAASVGSTFALAAVMQRASAHAIASHETAHRQQLDTQLVSVGHHLFLMNCAHCHADDASGDEGPDLHGLHKTDDRLRLLIINGIKGEMPRFGEKLADADVDAVVAFLDSLR